LRAHPERQKLENGKWKMVALFALQNLLPGPPLAGVSYALDGNVLGK
jgi:hypothetical protein